MFLLNPQCLVATSLSSWLFSLIDASFAFCHVEILFIYLFIYLQYKCICLGYLFEYVERFTPVSSDYCIVESS